MTLASLLVKIGITGLSTVEDGLDRVQRGVKRVAEESNQTRSALDGFEIPLLAAAGAAGSLLANISGIARMAASFSGIGMAAQFQRLEGGFTTLVGSAQKARDLLRDIQQIGASSPFETLEVAKFAQNMLAAGFSVETLADDMRTLVNTAAALGRSTSDVERAAAALGRIRRDINQVDADELNEFANAIGVNIGRIVGGSQGKQMSEQEASKFLQGLKPEEAARTLLQGMEREFKGAGATGILATINNLADTLGNMMLPTGKLLIPVVNAVASGMLAVANTAQKINEATGGGAGLVVLFGGLWRIQGLLTGSVMAAVSATRQLTASLLAYSTAAKMNSLNPFMGAAAAGKAIPVNGLRANIGRAGGLLPFLGNAASGFFKGGGAFFLGALGLGMAGNQMGGRSGQAISNIGAGMGLGATIGSIVPGIGTAAGAGIGAAIGALVPLIEKLANAARPLLSTLSNIVMPILDGLIKIYQPILEGLGKTILAVLDGLADILVPMVGMLQPVLDALVEVSTWIGGFLSWIGGQIDKAVNWVFGDDKKPDSAKSKDSENLQKTADALRDIRAQLIGGGQRANRVKSELEIEAVFGRILATGIG